MSKNTNRKGLALGAMFSLVATLFVGATPASATVSTDAFAFAPTKGSAYAVYVDHDFHMTVQRKPSANISATDFATYLKYEISTNRAHSASTFSLRVAAGTASVAVDTIQDAAAFALSRSSNTAVAAISNSQRIYYGGVPTIGQGSNLVIPQLVEGQVAPTLSYVVDPGSRSSAVTNFIGLQLGFHGAGLYPNSNSATVVVTVRAFLDLNGDNVYQSSSEPSGTQAVTFTRYSSAKPTVTLNSVQVGDESVVATVALGASTINLNQTDGKWGVRFEQHLANGRNSAVSYSHPAERSLNFTDGAGLSMTVSASITAAVASRTVSAFAIFFRDSGSFGDASPALAMTPVNVTGTGDNETFNDAASQSQVIAWEADQVTVTPASVGATGASLYAVSGANVLGTATATSAGGQGKADVRAGNQTFTVRLSTSGTATGATATFTFSNPTLTAFKTYAVDSGTQITTGTFSAVTKAIPAGTGIVDITITTVGFSAGDVISISARVSGVGGASYNVALYTVNPVYTVTADSTQLAVAPGGTVNVGVTVKDQFGVNSSAIDQRIRFEWGTPGYGGTATRSDVALVNARATAAMVHSPATSTLSATITATLQDSTGGVFSNTSGATNATINITVTSATNGFRTGLARSYSATISYGAAFSWSPVINDAYVIVTGSSVVVSGTGLIFKDDVTGATASDTLTLPGDSAGRVKFYVTARKAGTFTLTLTAGTATTTSLIVVSDAQDNAGSAIAFDVSSMESGRAAIVTGTLTDLNGNPVDTTLGNATIALSVTGTGATFVGSLTAESNADGKFQVALLSGVGQTGTITITAVYSPTSGAAAADKVTKVHTVSVVAPTAPEVNAVIGSFNGRWAVRVENARGSVVSVKAGNRWVKFTALNNNYLYSMRSVKGRTIAVSVWVDGELQNSQTITIK